MAIERERDDGLGGRSGVKQRVGDGGVYIGGGSGIEGRTPEVVVQELFWHSSLCTAHTLNTSWGVLRQVAPWLRRNCTKLGKECLAFFVWLGMRGFVSMSLGALPDP